MNERLKKIRESSGLNLRDFSDRLGMSHGSISLLENGKRNLTNQFISAVCKEFGVNEVWLRSGEGEMFAPVSKTEELALITKKLMNDEDPAYREELIKIIADMDLDTLKIWYDYAKQWVTSVENRIK